MQRENKLSNNAEWPPPAPEFTEVPIGAMELITCSLVYG